MRPPAAPPSTAPHPPAPAGPPRGAAARPPRHCSGWRRRSAPARVRACVCGVCVCARVRLRFYQAMVPLPPTWLHVHVIQTTGATGSIPFLSPPPPTHVVEPAPGAHEWERVVHHLQPHQRARGQHLLDGHHQLIKPPAGGRLGGRFDGRGRSRGLGLDGQSRSKQRTCSRADACPPLWV